ncbi:hypothetical protein [Caulobacter endophyticus]|uniref:hypothetical protein n=1 Tax=Caulobacter endophyticus TaxID=2172652 RepID=UPI002410A821|nr:hypothetical protein [Caulobacter endophyticus]MDG2528599.1 hypothetical protein [Caulobacter endophyticus]
MPAESRFVGNSIEELLVALAEGVREAQLALNSGPKVDASGAPIGGYQLPFLDFSIKVDMQTKTDNGGRPIALLFTAKDQNSTNQQVSSTISGRLVATPPGEGLPTPRIAVSGGGNIGGFAHVSVLVTNSAGEVLADQPVELNIDDAAGGQLSAARGVAHFVRQPGTRLQQAVLRTGADGRALATLSIAKEPARAVVVVVASIGAYSGRGVVGMEEIG